ncbi:hypothetical protein [Pedosphaera parvula]|nr:hypothetical protein [Pedosphaera parvula]
MTLFSPDVISGFDGKTPIQDMALLLTIFAEDEKGHESEALKDLKALAQNTKVSPDIRQSAQVILQGRQSKQ